MSGKLLAYRPRRDLTLTDAWQNILWREQRHCYDRAYAHRLKRLAGLPFAAWGGWLQGRPSATEVEVALWQMVSSQRSAMQTVWQKRLARLLDRQRDPGSPNHELDQVDHYRWFERFLARHALVALGGEAVADILQTSVKANKRLGTWLLKNWLLRSIEFETELRLKPELDRLLCSRCLTRIDKHDKQLSNVLSFSFYGCRRCEQSRTFYLADRVVAILDHTHRSEVVQRAEKFCINWTARRTLFDFDTVEIIAATDEAVERFAVQVGNDTEPIRQAGYKSMPCLVHHPELLSENSLRILRRTFAVETG